MRDADEEHDDAASILRELGVLFSDFDAYWLDDDNYFREEDGSFTLHGVFCRFADCYRERHASFTPEQLAALGQLVSRCMRVEHSNADNAVATCFLESIATEPCERVIAPYLDEAARAYLRAWGGLQDG